MRNPISLFKSHFSLWSGIGVVLVLLSVATVYYSKRHSVITEPLEQGYSIETVKLDEMTLRWRLNKNKQRIVTEAIVINDRVQTMLPTPFGWGCTGQGFHHNSKHLASVFCGALGDDPSLLHLQLNRRGDATIQCYGRTSDIDKFAMYGKLSQKIPMIAMIEIELPVKIENVDKLVKRVINHINLRDIVITPRMNPLSDQTTEN